MDNREKSCIFAAVMTEKEIYIQWCKTQEDLPLFMQPWWMDAVCAGKEWDVLLYKTERTQRVLAAMPYLLRKRLGMRYIIMPQMTQIGGIWLDKSLRNEDGSVWDRAELKNICTFMHQRLAEMNLCYYYQHYPVGSACPEEMEALGYKLKTRHTYRIDDLSDMDKVIDSFSKNKKRQLTRALSLHAERDMNPEAFYRFHSRCMEEHHKKIAYSREFLLVLERKTSRLQNGMILSICNPDGEVYAAAYLAWDNRYLYYLMPCYSPQHKDSGAGAMLALEAMKLAREKGVKFDFEGSMHRGIANHYKQFGSRPAEYRSVRKLFKWYFAFALFVNWINLLRYRI